MTGKMHPAYTPQLLGSIERHLVEQRYSQTGVRSWTLSGGADPRFIGQDELSGDRVSVDIRTAGYERAAQFRGWLTMSPGAARALTVERPDRWRFYQLMVGLLPDGMPWWTALWDLAPVARRWDDVSEEVIMDRGGVFYRVAPSSMPEDARPEVYDFLQPDLGLLSPPQVEVAPPDLITRIVGWEDRISRVADQELVQVDQLMLRVRRMIRSERERRSGTLSGA